VTEVFCAKYPEGSEMGLVPPKIKRVYAGMRPVRRSQIGEDPATSSVLFEYPESVKRHAALFSMQEKATSVLESTNKLLAEASLEPSSPELAELVVRLSNLHHEYEEWCFGHGKDIVAANNTRNSLRVALNQINDAIKNARNDQGIAQEEDAVVETTSHTPRMGGARGCYIAMWKKQTSYMKKVKELLNLHDELNTQLEIESKHNEHLNPPVESTSSAPRIQVAPLVDAADSVRELENEICNSEKALAALYEKKRKFGMPVMTARERKPKYLGFFLLSDGKVKHYSVGLDGETGDERSCQLLLAKHGYSPSRKGKRITDYTGVSR
jgi:hypothetical protein